jgi:hypothetical protein
MQKEKEWSGWDLNSKILLPYLLLLDRYRWDVA